MRRRLDIAWSVLRGAVEGSRRDGVPMLAQALAYSLFLAIPATALVILGLFSLVADPNLVHRSIAHLGHVLPSQTSRLLEESLTRSSASTSSGVAMTVLGFALALWTTSSAATTLMNGLSRAYEREDERGLVRKRLVAFAIVLALVVAAALVVSLLVMGPPLERWIGSALHAQRATAWAWWTVQWPLLAGALLFVFAVVLYLGPDVEGRRWKLVTPGALTAVVLWLLVSGGFAIYVAHFGSYEKTWGSLSAVVVTLVWLWATSAALLFGAEVDAQALRRSVESEGEGAAGARDGVGRSAIVGR